MRNPGIKTLLNQYNQKSANYSLPPETIESLKNVSSVVLAIVAGAGIIALSVAAPNVIGAIGQIAKLAKNGKKYKSGRVGGQVTQAVYYLKRSGQIKLHKQGNDFIISLTKLGRKKVNEFRYETLKITKPQTWAKKWWLIAADIPTKDYRWAADLLRRKLKEMNFYPLQRTLWLYPHEPINELQYLLQLFHIEHYVTVMEVSRLDKEDETRAKKFFKSKKIL